MTFAERLQELIDGAGWGDKSVYTIADLIGVSHVSLYRWLAGSMPNGSAQMIMAKAFGFDDLGEFMKGVKVI